MMLPERRQTLPIVGLLLVCTGAAYAVAQMAAAPGQIPPAIGDFATISGVEVRAADGAVVLAGEFGAAVSDEGETERTATLSPAGAVQGAAGTAEVEWVVKGNQTERELELEVDGLPAGSSFTLVIDGQQAATFTTGQGGDAEIELRDVR